jgi:hypothetical protein
LYLEVLDIKAIWNAQKEGFLRKHLGEERLEAQIEAF